MTKALIVYGGWEGHNPAGMAAFLAGLLEQAGIESVVTNTFTELERLHGDEFQLVVPVWTMEHLEPHLLKAILDAVRRGVGLATLHGVIDSFRHEAEFHYMLGGQWVTHFEFAVRTYEVTIADGSSPLTQGLTNFEVTTEQYYLLVDPANSVLATMQVDGTTMPVAWTKTYGSGRIFYCSLGHAVDTVSHPTAQELLKRGMAWAAGTL
jgi:type 1 glutamine amidotransferase